MTQKAIKELYREWRRQYKNHRPNRAVVRIKWEDGDNTEKGWQEDIVALKAFDIDFPPDDGEILYYASGLRGLLELTKPNNGSGFIVAEVRQFYRYAE